MDTLPRQKMKTGWITAKTESRVGSGGRTHVFDTDITISVHHRRKWVRMCTQGCLFFYHPWTRANADSIARADWRTQSNGFENGKNSSAWLTWREIYIQALQIDRSIRLCLNRGRIKWRRRKTFLYARKWYFRNKENFLTDLLRLLYTIRVEFTQCYVWSTYMSIFMLFPRDSLVPLLSGLFCNGFYQIWIRCLSMYNLAFP